MPPLPLRRAPSGWPAERRSRSRAPRPVPPVQRAPQAAPGPVPAAAATPSVSAAVPQVQLIPASAEGALDADQERDGGSARCGSRPA
ncbi:hypothetical protein DRB96_42315 [Streptomyces sp. ICC1]|nr:hypothetical protein DRB96_42315 [Streptomyces sp. ICC1]